MKEKCNSGGREEGREERAIIIKGRIEGRKDGRGERKPLGKREIK